ncbi:hypothetical protein ACM6WB_004380 [Vibrio vulnificus]|nr:hypothetical protein [Vibrio vulnificus]
MFSNFFLITSVCLLFLSILFLVILADAGIHRTASVVVWYFRFIASVVGFALCSYWLWQVRFQTWHLACVDEWIPVCTGMTVGGVTGADFLCETVLLVFSIILYSSNFFLLTSVCLLFLSILFLVILAKAGIHRTASVVARCYRFIASVVVSFALCCLLRRVRFQTRHPVRVDEWIPVCTGMTVGGVVGMC